MSDNSQDIEYGVVMITGSKVTLSRDLFADPFKAETLRHAAQSNIALAFRYGIELEAIATNDYQIVLKSKDVPGVETAYVVVYRV